MDQRHANFPQGDGFDLHAWRTVAFRARRERKNVTG
jgi:hypothetical protein